MSEHTIHISFPVKENLLRLLKATEAEFIQDIRFSAALSFYRKQKLSLGKAAELAGYSKIDFIQKLQAAGEPIFEYSDAELETIFTDVDAIK